MRAVTLHQPSLCYVAGVVAGDGWLSSLSLGLRVADRDFAAAFTLSFGVEVQGPRRDERGYWLVRASNKSGRFNAIDDATPLASPAATAAWLRGFFDSEGNASLIPRPAVSEAAYQRRVAFYNTDTVLLDLASGMLLGLGITCYPLRAMSHRDSAGRFGSRPCWELQLRLGAENLARFADIVGSTIGRKEERLDALAPSYQPPGHHARAQARGVEVRRARAAAGGRY